ncbi:MAG: PTS transporter subunit EIIA [Desulfatitalea sp.]|nr:PTS sugar transporter subunit IIA [Desulfatitalea sp.]NNK00272.1 PTS transporter subunit EIIA [Desulfatitalea sp.]
MELSIDEVAKRLNVPLETVQRWVRQGKIPMLHQRGEYTIRVEMLKRWAGERKLNVRTTDTDTASSSDGKAEFDGVLPAMQRGGVFYDLAGETKEQVLRSAVTCMPNLARIDRAVILEKLIERENLASTGIGNGIALPHPRANPGIGLVSPQISTCFLKRPIDFDAIDRQPVAVLMVLLSNTTELHLSLLSKLSFFLRDRSFCDLLRTIPTSDRLFARIATMEGIEHSTLPK